MGPGAIFVSPGWSVVRVSETPETKEEIIA